jgi:hypothetical protein
MNPLDVFLREHASVHSKDAAPEGFDIDLLFDGLTDEQYRACPHGLNSIAWLLWHIARVEDGLVSLVVGHRPQLFDDAWAGWRGQQRKPFPGAATGRWPRPRGPRAWTSAAQRRAAG